MKVITYTSDTMLRPRHVLAAVADGQLILRREPLTKKEVYREVSVLHAAEKLEALRQLPGPKALEGWIRWQGLAVELEEVEDAPLEQVFATPLPPRHPRMKRRRATPKTSEAAPQDGGAPRKPRAATAPRPRRNAA